MKLKKWILGIIGSSGMGIVISLCYVFVPILIGAIIYNIVMEPPKIENTEEDKTKIHRVGKDCPCGCVYIGGTGSTGIVGGSSGSLEFTGTEDKTDFVNASFYLNKIVSDSVGIPIWVPYAMNSVETGGTIYGKGVNLIWDTGTFNGLDKSTATSLYERDSNGNGAAGFFQVEGNSIASEMGYVAKDIDKYLAIMTKAGLDSSNYPGMQAALKEEYKLGYTNWYQDCTYYPAAIFNTAEDLVGQKNAVLQSDWLNSKDWFNQYTKEEKDLIGYYVALTLWNNGKNSIDSYYKNNDVFANYIRAFYDIMKNKYSEFSNQSFTGTTGNGGNGSYNNAKKALGPAEWVVANTSVLTDEEKSNILNELHRDGSGTFNSDIVFRRFAAYGTNAVYNTLSKNSASSVLKGLSEHGITITNGWNLLSVGNNFNLGDNTSGTTTTPNTNNSSGNSGSTGNLGSNASSTSLGKYIEDVTANPKGIPLYDGFTMDTAKYNYFDTNYSRFWDGTTASSHPLYGLGDFQNDKTNKVTYEGKNNLVKKSPAVEFKGSYSTIDGRIAFAAPPAIAVSGDVLTEIQNQIKDTSRYKYPSYNNDPPVINGDGNVPGYSGTTALGLYFDIILNDGTVIPAIIADTKGMHYGLYRSKGDGLWHDDTMSEGYCQMKWKVSNGNRGSLSYKTILEAVGGNSNSFFSNDILGNKKISGIRTYKIQHNSSGGWVKYFTEGGTSSSFGSSGGSSTGNASIGGTGGGTTPGTSGINPNDPNWKCSCNIPCKDCDCHEGSTGSESGNTTAVLAETPGLPQGLYCDLNGKQLTPQEVWSLFEAKAPNIAKTYKSGIGMAPKQSTIATQDKLRGTFGDNTGILHYTQWSQAEAYSDFPLVYASRTSDGFASNTSSGSRRADKLTTFASSGCGFCAQSIIASSMLHKYITPAEIVMAGYLSPILNTDGSSSGNIYVGNVFNYAKGAAIWDTFRFNGEKLFNVKTGSVNKDEWDAVLNEGGMVSFCAHSMWTVGGHFVVCRERITKSDGSEAYLTVDSSGTETGRLPGGRPSVEHPWSDFTSNGVNQILYVTKGPAYDKYIASLSTGSSGSTGRLTGMSQSTQDIIKMSEAELYKIMTGYDSYSAINSVWKTQPGMVRVLLNTKVVSIEVPVWKFKNTGYAEKVAGTQKLTVNRALEGYFKDFFNELYALPEKYVIQNIGGLGWTGGFGVRSKTNSTNISGHSFGGTVDINCEAPGHQFGGLPYKSSSGLVEPFKSGTCTWDSSWFKLAQKYKLNWGGMWGTGGTDGMHFSIIGDESSAGGHFPNYVYTPRNSGR